MSHTFHIPVLGLAFSIDTPVKVAHYGISSVISIVDDILLERMRHFHSENLGENFIAISDREPDFRAKRICAYLNLVRRIVAKKFSELRMSKFEPGSEICKYFEMLPVNSPLKARYLEMLQADDEQIKLQNQEELRDEMVCGAIDVNIMAKVDKLNYSKDVEVMNEVSSDALAALRGFATSDLNASVVLSAGMNPRLYSYLEEFEDFYPCTDGKLMKRIILKVSDFRSAFIQAKFLAKKGLWVSEFRVESGLNCGGHAFATDGFLLGPILEEFKTRRSEMHGVLTELYNNSLHTKGYALGEIPPQRITVQGGIGNASENEFLMDHYSLDGTGWGSPFLLVPEATNVDEDTLTKLTQAVPDDYYISGSSPLGVPFNNFRRSSAEQQRLERIRKGVPGSPCKKRYLVSNTEFTKQPICTASREFQRLKLKELSAKGLPQSEYDQLFNQITEKVCLCEGLASTAYIRNHILKPRESQAVAICPGPNLAYFTGVFTLREMVDHIYGIKDILGTSSRPHLFINELNLYVKYLQKDFELHLYTLDEKKRKYFSKFHKELHNGIAYYRNLVGRLLPKSESRYEQFLADLRRAEHLLDSIVKLKMADG